MTQGLMGVAGGAAGAGAAGGPGQPLSVTTGSTHDAAGSEAPSEGGTQGPGAAPGGTGGTGAPAGAEQPQPRPAGPGRPAPATAARRAAVPSGRARGLDGALAGWRTELASLGGPEPLMTAEDLRDGSPTPPPP